MGPRRGWGADLNKFRSGRWRGEPAHCHKATYHALSQALSGHTVVGEDLWVEGDAGRLLSELQGNGAAGAAAATDVSDWRIS
eukprot:4977148-Pyramimonas_sp.AAC.1